jgi:DNA-binding protein Fis
MQRRKQRRRRAVRWALRLSAEEQRERDRIVAALKQCIGNQTRAAKVLGISRATLVNRLALYRLPRPRK